MKRLFLTLLIISAALMPLCAQKDTIFLNSGKYYVCQVIDANSQYVQYATAISNSQVERIGRDEKKGTQLPDVIYLNNGRKITCSIKSEKNGFIRYARSISSKMVKSLHMHDGKKIPASEWNTPIVAETVKQPEKKQSDEEIQEIVENIFDEENVLDEYDILNMADGTRRKGNIVAMTHSVAKFIDLESDGRVQNIPLVQLESIVNSKGQVIVFEDMPSDPFEILAPKQ